MNNQLLWTTATVWLAVLILASTGLNHGSRSLAAFQFCEKIVKDVAYSAPPERQAFGFPFKFFSQDVYPASCGTSKRAHYGNYQLVFPGVIFELLLYVGLVGVTYQFIARSKAQRGIA